MAITHTWKGEILKHGVPSLIKMDIEGHELEFLNDPDFIDFIKRGKTVWAMEAHTAEINSRARALVVGGINNSYQHNSSFFCMKGNCDI